MSDADFESSEGEGVTEGDTNGDGKKYERSTIAFPYGSLKDAEEVARSLHAKWGDSAEIDQLAAGMGTTKASGAFRAKVATARTFGVIDGSRGRVKLTPTGKQIIDPATMATARVDAFLRVPLFKVLYERKKGALLPPDEALENEILELGVSSRQTDRARQAFQRSAEQAGFFAHGRDRLIQPNVGKLPDSDSGTGKDREKTGGDAKITNMPRSDLRPQVVELLATLLTDGADWPPEKIVEFLSTARKLNELLK